MVKISMTVWKVHKTTIATKTCNKNSALHF